MSPEEASFFRRLPTNQASACRSGNKNLCIQACESRIGGGTTSTSGGLFLEPTSDIKVYQNGGWLFAPVAPIYTNSEGALLLYLHSRHGHGVSSVKSTRSPSTTMFTRHFFELLAGRNRMWSQGIFDAPLNPGVFLLCRVKYGWWQPEIRQKTQLRLVVHPMIYRVLGYMPGGFSGYARLMVEAVASGPGSQQRDPKILAPLNLGKLNPPFDDFIYLFFKWVGITTN